MFFLIDYPTYAPQFYKPLKGHHSASYVPAGINATYVISSHNFSHPFLATSQWISSVFPLLLLHSSCSAVTRMVHNTRCSLTDVFHTCNMVPTLILTYPMPFLLSIYLWCHYQGDLDLHLCTSSGPCHLFCM